MLSHAIECRHWHLSKDEPTSIATYKTNYNELQCAGVTGDQDKSVRSPNRKVKEL
jgi:hypothetical protein